MAEIEKRFQDASALLEKEEFLEKLKGVNTDEECQKLFADNGVELSIDDIRMMVEESAKAAKTGELSDEDLDNVSGGIIITASTAACFVVGSAAIGFFSSYGYHSYVRKR